MKKYVIYTVMTGGYDKILQPLIVDDRFDYVLFSNDFEEKKIGVWQVRPIPYDCEDLTRLSRYPKMHPEELLSSYKASLYMDANLQITSSELYNRIVELYDEDVDWAGIKHPYRDCIFDEAYSVYGLDNENVIFRWCHRLRKENYPRHRGMFENNIIYRRHNERTKVADEKWWNLYMNFTRRDQLTLMYVLWQMPDIKTAYLLPPNENAWNSNNVRILKHRKKSQQGGRRSLKQSFLEHARCRCRCGMKEKTEQFREFHYWLYGLNPTLARMLLDIWGIYALIVYGIIIKYRAYKKHKNHE